MSGVKDDMHEMISMSDTKGSVGGIGNITGENVNGSEGPVAGTDNSNGGGCTVNKKRRLVRSSSKEDEKTDHSLSEVKKAEEAEHPANSTGTRSESCDGCMVNTETGEKSKEKRSNNRADVGKQEQNPWSTLFPSLKRGGSKTKSSERREVPETNPAERQGVAETKTKRDDKLSSMKACNVLADGTSWKAGEPVLFSTFCKALKQIEETSSRLDITETLRRFFVSVITLTPQDLEACVYLACGKVSIHI